ncbi:hypothetical protein MNV49_001764 [Pseudohyphozyma bogoriensis]|nr:hypothetical protein MNV49_001764 [Pseudohyphozyma bogoriensis]
MVGTLPRTLPAFPYADLLDKGPFGDWRDDLARDGYVVIPAMTEEKAAEYRQRALKWLSDFGYGFDPEKPETYSQEHLPMHVRGGMYIGSAYKIAHTQWAWDIRSEPGVINAFKTLWGTDELVTSFDGGSLMMPFQPTPKEAVSWQHIDLHPARVGFFACQGIVNLNHNGPLDGGLQVMKGSHNLMKKFFDEHGRPPVPLEGRVDFHLFSIEDKQWFIDQGCKWIKVCANVCMGPVSLRSAEDKTTMDKAWADSLGTTHTPFHGCHIFEYPVPTRPNGEKETQWGDNLDLVIPNETILKLAGQLPY